MKDTAPPTRNGDVVLGDDWVAPDSNVENELRVRRERRGLFSLKASPLARKIITFNLIALNVLVAGILYLNSSRDSLALQRANALVSEAELIADVFEAQLSANAAVDLGSTDALDVSDTLAGLDLRSGIEVFVFNVDETLISMTEGRTDGGVLGGTKANENSKTLITDGLSSIWNAVSRVFSSGQSDADIPIQDQLKEFLPDTLANGTQVENSQPRFCTTGRPSVLSR